MRLASSFYTLFAGRWALWSVLGPKLCVCVFDWCLKRVGFLTLSSKLYGTFASGLGLSS